MRKDRSITEIEQEMELLVDRLFFAGNMEVWSTLISRFHSLGVKLSQMKGEQPEVTHGKSDYII